VEQVQVQVQQFDHRDGDHGDENQEPEQEAQRSRDVPVGIVVE
jgi:hypothetical protein